MANKKDIFVPASYTVEQRATYLAATAVAVAPEWTVWRFADDNDGAQYHNGQFYRVCKSREEAVALAARSAGQRYMGRKRQEWTLLQLEAQ